MGGYAAILKNACNIISSSGLGEYLFNIKKNKMDIYSDFDLNLCLNTLNDIICIVDFSRMHFTNTDKNDFIWLVDEMKKVLQEIIKRYPSNVEALALLAKLCLELNDKDGLEGITSSRSMQNCPESSLIMVIEAQSQLRSNSISHSINILEDARAKNFSIQQHPLYCLTKGSTMFYQVSSHCESSSSSIEIQQLSMFQYYSNGLQNYHTTRVSLEVQMSNSIIFLLS